MPNIGGHNTYRPKEGFPLNTSESLVELRSSASSSSLYIVNNN